MTTIAPWHEFEIELTARADRANPYTEVDVWVDFVNNSGTTIRRPAFWDGGRTPERLVQTGSGPRVVIFFDE